MSDSYDEEVRFLDAQIGEMFRALKERGLYGETLIVFASDHGEEFLEKGEIAHGTSLYDVLLRVPLIIKFPCPGLHCSPRVVDDQVTLLDLMPTILQLVGLPVPRGVQGRNLIDESLAGTPAFSELGDMIAMRTRDRKYILSMTDGSEELYALRSDPSETHNLATEFPEQAKEFNQSLRAWLEGVSPKRPSKRSKVTLDDETAERLRALGYLPPSGEREEAAKD